MTKPTNYPEFFPVRQRFDSLPIDDIPLAVKRTLAQSSLADRIQPGQTVALGVGSRGINNLREIVSAVVAEVASLGGKPMVVPAMGSHGGATADGQTKVLASLGIDESIGCPVRASMETVVAGKTRDGVEAHFDKLASGVDHVIVINAKKVRLTGGKEDQKVYRRHTGYPGGLKETPIRKMRATHPERIVELAIWGMLPKSTLGKHMYKKLKVYAGDQHPHQAQKPVALEV